MVLVAIESGGEDFEVGGFWISYACIIYFRESAYYSSFQVLHLLIFFTGKKKFSSAEGNSDVPLK